MNYDTFFKSMQYLDTWHMTKIYKIAFPLHNILKLDIIRG